MAMRRLTLGSWTARAAGGNAIPGLVRSPTLTFGSVSSDIAASRDVVGSTEPVPFASGYPEVGGTDAGGVRTTGSRRPARAMFWMLGNGGTGITVTGAAARGISGGGTAGATCGIVTTGFVGTRELSSWSIAPIGAVFGRAAEDADEESLVVTTAIGRVVGRVVGDGRGGAGDGGPTSAAASASSEATRDLASAIVHSQSSSSTVGAGATATAITAADAATGAGRPIEPAVIAGVSIEEMAISGAAIGGVATRLARDRTDVGDAGAHALSSTNALSPSCQPTILPPVPSSNTVGRNDKIRPSGVSTNP